MCVMREEFFGMIHNLVYFDGADNQATTCPKFRLNQADEELNKSSIKHNNMIIIS